MDPSAVTETFIHIGGPLDGERRFCKPGTPTTLCMELKSVFPWVKEDDGETASYEAKRYFREKFTGDIVIFSFYRYEDTSLDDCVEKLLANYHPRDTKHDQGDAR